MGSAAVSAGHVLNRAEIGAWSEPVVVLVEFGGRSPGFTDAPDG